jgi:hypothetical protein
MFKAHRFRRSGRDLKIDAPNDDPSQGILANRWTMSAPSWLTS